MLSGLILLQTVCRAYKQKMTLANKVLIVRLLQIGKSIKECDLMNLIDISAC